MKLSLFKPVILQLNYSVKQGGRLDFQALNTDFRIRKLSDRTKIVTQSLCELLGVQHNVANFCKYHNIKIGHCLWDTQKA